MNIDIGGVVVSAIMGAVLSLHTCIDILMNVYLYRIQNCMLFF